VSVNDTREALEAVRRLLTSMAPSPTLSSGTDGDTEQYRRGWDEAKGRAVNVVDSALACFPQKHEWQLARLVTAGTGDVSVGPFSICRKCRRRSDCDTPLNCTPLPPDVLARWDAADDAFAQAQQAMQVARQAGAARKCAD
jgi:hypothetical protein